MKIDQDHIKTKDNKENNELFSGLGDILARYLKFDSSRKEDPIAPRKQAPRIEKLRILSFLKPIPWFLTGLFLFSFYWDFPGSSLTVWGLELQFDGILRIVSVSGMIGFLTNWIAITMLFRPLKKRPLLGQGLIPAHKERIAYRLAHAVSEDLINPKLINEKIRESEAISRYRKFTLLHLQRITRKEEFRQDLKNWLVGYIKAQVQNHEFRTKVADYILLELEDALQDKVLEKAALKTYSFFRGQSLQEFIEDLLQHIPVSAERNIQYVEEYLDDLPVRINNNSDKLDEVILQVLNRLVNQLNVHELVEENLKRYDEQKLETMIRNATNEQLKTIQYLGALLGTIGGFVIWEPLLSMSILAVLFGGIYLIDKKLFGDLRITNK